MQTMPKTTKTATTVRFNPLAPTLAAEANEKEAKAFADLALEEVKEPAVRFPARPTPDFADVLSVLSMHTNNNLCKEAKAFNNELKLSNLDNLIFAVIKGKVQGHRALVFGCGTKCGGVDIFKHDLAMSGFDFRKRITQVSLAVIKKLNDLGYSVLEFSDTSDGALISVQWVPRAPSPPNDRWTLHLATGELEPQDKDFVPEGEQEEDTEEEEEE